MSWLKRRAVEAAEKVLPCSCDAAYTDRGLIAPDCSWHQHGDVVADAIETVAREFADRVLLAVDFGTDFMTVGRGSTMDVALRAEALALADKDEHSLQAELNDALAAASIHAAEHRKLRASQAETLALLTAAYRALRSYQSPQELMKRIGEFLERTEKTHE